jgi:hypothetical protein
MKRLHDPIEVTPELLAKWRFRFRPGGSGPSSRKYIVQLCEAVAAAEGIDLDDVEWVNGDGAKMKGLERVPEASTMNWNELAIRIGQMTPEQRRQPVLTFDSNEGEFCELTEVAFGSYFYLKQANTPWKPDE